MIHHLMCVIEGCDSKGLYCDGDDFISVLVDHSHPVDADEADLCLETLCGKRLQEPLQT